MDSEDEVAKMADAIAHKIEETIGRPLSEIDWWVSDLTVHHDNIKTPSLVIDPIDLSEGIPLGKFVNLTGGRPVGKLKSFLLFQLMRRDIPQPSKTPEEKT